MSTELKHNSVKEKKPINKKAIIIGAAALVCVIIAAVVIIVVVNANKHHGLKVPKNDAIIADMEKDKTVSEVKVGKKTFDFKISEFDKTDDKTAPEGDNPTKYIVWATVSRESDVYGIKPVDYKIVYVLKGEKLKYKSATPLSEKLRFTALAGADKDDAAKRVRKVYKKAKFKEQKTDLTKGKDEIFFKVNNKEFEGTANVKYLFSSKKGWVFKKLDDKKVGFKKGVTHKENGLYTNSNIKNVLFLGIDSFDGNGRSDVMMLISIDNNTGKIKQTSFMRDNWFDIPGYGDDKLNAAYVYGGAKLTVQTISNTFGIKIDNYAVVNFSTFMKIIDKLGGIDVDLTSDEAGYINWQIKSNHQVDRVGLLSTKGGKTHLNGQQALWLCRDRGGGGFSGDDFARTGRQRKVIQALINTYNTYTPAKVLATINAVKEDNVITDLTASDLKWYAERSPKIFKYKFQERCVPTDGEWQSGYSDGGAWIIKLNDFDGLKRGVQTDIYEDLK